MVRALLADPACVVLVATHSNQAVDTFLEGLLDSGVPSSTILRLGGFSSSERIQKLTLFELTNAKTGGNKKQKKKSKAERAAWSCLHRRIDDSKKRIHSLWGKLVQTEWDNPALVPLAAVEHVITVCQPSYRA